VRKAARAGRARIRQFLHEGGGGQQGDHWVTSRMLLYLGRRHDRSNSRGVVDHDSRVQDLMRSLELESRQVCFSQCVCWGRKGSVDVRSDWNSVVNMPCMTEVWWK
jgi:hypothetical protein